jgi:hypothetical protein
MSETRPTNPDRVPPSGEGPDQQARAFPKRCGDPEDVRRKYPHRADKLAVYLFRGDPPADDVADLFCRLPPGHGTKMLDRLLEHGIGAVPQPPRVLRDFYAAVADVPLWLDWDLLDLGSRTYMRCGFVGGIVLGCCALPLAYRSASASKPLVFSREFYLRAVRRLSETNRFFFETCKPGGLRRHRPGWQITVRVRLMHAQMRRLLRQGKSRPWKEDHWGVPINQVDMAVASLLFSASQLGHLRRVGFHFSAAESEGVMHLWRYCGRLIGLAPELLCATEAEGQHLLRLLLGVYDAPDAGSVRLTRALMERAMPMLLAAILPWVIPAGDLPGKGRSRGWLGRVGLGVAPATFRRQMSRFCYGLSHGLLGGPVVAGLEYPGTAWRHTAPLLLRALVTPAEVCRRLLPWGTALAARLGQKQMERLMLIQVFAAHPLFRLMLSSPDDAPEPGSHAGGPTDAR